MSDPDPFERMIADCMLHPEVLLCCGECGCSHFELSTRQGEKGILPSARTADIRGTCYSRSFMRRRNNDPERWQVLRDTIDYRMLSRVECLECFDTITKQREEIERLRCYVEDTIATLAEDVAFRAEMQATISKLETENTALRERARLAEDVAFRVQVLFPMPVYFRRNRNGTMSMDHEIDEEDILGFLQALHDFAGDCRCGTDDGDGNG